MRNGWVVVAAAAVVALGIALAGALRPFAGPLTLEQQVMRVAADLRCPVCAGESTASSNSAEAIAMRAQIGTDLEHGMTPRQIRQTYVAQYGTWILYRPPHRGASELLWIVPLLALPAIGGVLWRTLGRAPREPEGAAAAPGVEAPDLERELERYL